VKEKEYVANALLIIGKEKNCQHVILKKKKKKITIGAWRIT